MRKSVLWGIGAALTVITLAAPASASAASTEPPFTITSLPDKSLVMAPVDRGPGAPVVLSKRNGSPLQWWTAMKVSDGRYAYTNVESRMCLDAYHLYLTADPCDGRVTEEFLSIFNAERAADWLVSSKGLCLQASPVPDVVVEQRACSDAPSQNWRGI